MSAYGSFRAAGMALVTALLIALPASAAQLVDAPAGQNEAAGRGASGVCSGGIVSAARVSAGSRPAGIFSGGLSTADAKSPGLAQLTLNSEPQPATDRHSDRQSTARK